MTIETRAPVECHVRPASHSNGFRVFVSTVKVAEL